MRKLTTGTGIALGPDIGDVAWGVIIGGWPQSLVALNVHWVLGQ
jgi:hypothetical protein